ncbi:hypothetical protein SCA6_009845 [Theobroma cacao]
MAVRVATQVLTRNIQRSGAGVVKLNHMHLHVRQLETLTLPDLPYDYHELEPVFSTEIMELHHQKHHQTYITNFNRAQEQLHHAMSKADSTTVVKLQSSIKFNGGGAFFSSIPFSTLAPVTVSLILIHLFIQSLYTFMFSLKQNQKHIKLWQKAGGEPLAGALGKVIHTQFGSLERLIDKINKEGAALQGSGSVWLALDKENELKKLSIETTAKQYKNVRANYLANIWKVINWEYASEMYDKECS